MKTIKFDKTFGVDAECCLSSPRGRALCAIYRLPEKCDAVALHPNSNAWCYHDNINVEFGIRPTRSIDAAVKRIRDGIKLVMDSADHHHAGVVLDDGCRIHKGDTADKPGWDVSGCNITFSPRNKDGAPVFNDYTTFLNEVGTMMGFHLHFSSPELKKISAKREVRNFHLRLAHIMSAVIPPITWMFGKSEWCHKRYGGLGVGNFRVPAYGFESKDPGSSLLCSPLSAEVVMRAASILVDLCLAEVVRGKRIPLVDHLSQRSVAEVHSIASSPGSMQNEFYYVWDCLSQAPVSDNPFTDDSLLKKAEELEHIPDFVKEWEL